MSSAIVYRKRTMSILRKSDPIQVDQSFSLYRWSRERWMECLAMQGAPCKRQTEDWALNGHLEYFKLLKREVYKTYTTVSLNSNSRK